MRKGERKYKFYRVIIYNTLNFGSKITIDHLRFRNHSSYIIYVLNLK